MHIEPQDRTEEIASPELNALGQMEQEISSAVSDRCSNTRKAYPLSSGLFGVGTNDRALEMILPGHPDNILTIGVAAPAESTLLSPLPNSAPCPPSLTSYSQLTAWEEFD